MPLFFMDYLFFDTECANCFNGIGKLCEFGYVLTDSSFNVIKQENILINPESKFDVKGLKYGHITLSLPYNEYKKCPTFIDVYPKIKRLLTRKNTVVIGYSTSGDAKYIEGTINRYKLPQINYLFLDLKKVVADIEKKENGLHLIDVYNDYYPKTNNHHTGLVDAILTLKIAKYIDENRVKFEKIVKNPKYYGEVFLNRIIDHEYNILPYSNSNKMNKKNAAIFHELVHDNHKCTGNRFYFKEEYLKENFPIASLVVFNMTKHNYKYAKGVPIPINIFTNLPRKPFLRKIGLTKKELKDIDLENIYANVSKYRNWYRTYLKHKRTLSIFN